MTPSRALDTVVEVGPLFAGDTGPSIEMQFLWDGGGIVDITGAAVEVVIRRWDTRRQQAIGAVVTTGSALLTSPVGGRATFLWTDATPIAHVPVDTGWYLGQAEVTFSDSTQQHTQRFIFEVRASN